MKAPKVEVEVTYFKVFHGFKSLGYFSAYQLSQFPEWELALYWAIPE